MALGLRTRIQLLLLGFVALLGTVAFGVFLTLEQRFISVSLGYDVSRASAILDTYMTRRSKDLRAQAALIADLPTMKSAMVYSHADSATVYERFSAYQSRLHTESFVITDDLGREVTGNGTVAKNLKDPRTLPGVRSALDGKAWSGPIVRNGVLFVGASVPMTVAGYVKGTINVYDRIDGTTAGDVGRELALDVAFVVHNRVVGSSVPLSTIGDPGTGLVDTKIGGKRLVGLSSPFPGTTISDEVRLVTLCNYDDLLSPFKETQRSLGLVLIVTLAFAVFIARIIASRMLAKIDGLLTFARALKEGRWPEPIPVQRNDEEGLLQSTFNEMSQSLQTSHQLLIDRAEELKESVYNAEAGTRAKVDFMANVSHECRTPMNGIMGMISLLQETRLSAAQRDYVATIASSSEHMLQVINDILDFSNLESGNLHLKSGPFNLCALIEDCVSPYQTLAKEKGVQLAVTLNCRSEELTGDQKRIAQVVSNLVSNAVKFTKTGWIHVTCTEERGHFTLLVEDTGVGISGDLLKDIFLPFSQADSSRTRKFGGTGLGLSICNQFAELMGGTLSVESKVDLGTKFRFELDLNRAKATGPKAGELAGWRVLIVEDNLVNQKVATKLLQRLGCTVTCAENGIVGVEKSVEGFDLILMDLHMPEMDGFDATLSIREREKETQQHVPIFALTASALEEDRLRSQVVGMDAYLVKPLRTEMLTGLQPKEYVDRAA